MEKKILEAALFISDRPLKTKELGKIAGVSSLGHVEEMLKDIQEEYEERGIQVNETPAGWEMGVHQDILPKVSHLTPYSDLTEGCKRTLALIVYKEPAKQSEIVDIQGNKTYSYVKKLEERGLIRSEKAGRTKVLEVTKEFERYFGEEKEAVKKRLSESIERQERQLEEVERKGKEVKLEDLEAEGTEDERESESKKEGESSKGKKKAGKELEKEEEGTDKKEKTEEKSKGKSGKRTKKSSKKSEEEKSKKSGKKKTKKKPQDKFKNRKPVPSDDENEYIIK